MNTTPEQWRTIPGWPNHEVSDLGRFRKKECKNTRGYLIPAHDLKVHVQKYCAAGYKHAFVCLWDRSHHKNINAAHLVLLAFEGPAPTKKMNNARHLDDDITNNKLSNLAWGTHKQNVHDAIRNGRRSTYGEGVKKSKLTEQDIIEIRQKCVPWNRSSGVRVFAKLYGVNEGTIQNVINNKTWKHL